MNLCKAAGGRVFTHLAHIIGALGGGSLAYNWSKIRTEYVSGKLSYKALADKHGVSLQQIAKVAKEQRWPEKRKAHREKVAAKALAKAEERQANELAALMESTDSLIGAITSALRDPQQFHRHIVSIGCGAEVEERIYEKVDTKAVRDLTAAIKDLAQLQREFHNIPTPAQAEAQRIAAERLAMDKKKAEAGEQTDRTIEIVMGGGAKEYTG